MTNTFSSNSFLDKGLQHICGRSFLEFWFLPQLKSEIGKCKSQEERDAFLSVEHVLESLGFEMIIFRLNCEYLHRVFNRKSFQYGGRAYGALHQNLPKHMRPFIHINGEKTVEIDYSAYHIRMLYNKKDIDYTDDPYSVCEGPEMRAIYKAVGLISINAKKNEACGAIRDELKKRKLVAPQRNERFKTLVRKFRDTHKPIEQYLFSGIGLTLQNIDGHIMNAILIRLMDKGILGLSVYDSVIVAEKHEAFTKEVMAEEYKNIMGFNPRF
jgi:DNA-binding ferritin-like protein (Dps family)